MRHAIFLLGFICFAGINLSSFCLGAVVVNGSFENGLTGWTTVGGDTASVGPVYGISPTNLASQGRMITSGTVASDATLETELGLTAGRLDTLDGGSAPSALNGTGLYQTITGVVAGDELRFDWQFVTNENVSFLGFNDFAFWSLTGGTNPIPGTVLTKAVTSTTPTENAGFSFKSAPGSVTFQFLAGGDFKLGFGVVNSQSGATESGLLIDNVRIISAVPEPSTMAMLGLAGAVLAFRRRRGPIAKLA